MHELLPIALGAAVGTATLRLARPRARLAVRAVAAAVIGAVAVVAGGEDPPLVLWDAAQALVAAVAAGALAARPARTADALPRPRRGGGRRGR